MADLRNVPIFRVGKWNGIPFSEADLDDMVANFELLSDAHKVPLKLGHDKPTKEQLAGSPDGQPALGWVQNLRRIGTDLVADFINVPKVMKEAIGKKLYRTLSIELLMGVKHGEKVLRHVLDAVALLGADQPAVHSLGDLDRYLAGRSIAFDDSGHRLVFETIAGNSTTEDNEMDEKEVKKLIADSLADFSKSLLADVKKVVSGDDDDEGRKKFAAERDRADKLDREVKAMKEADAERDKKDKAEKVKFARKGAQDMLEAAVKAESITPAQREHFTKLFGIDDDVRVVRETLIDEIKDTLTTFGVKLPNKEGTGMSDPDANNREKDVFKETERRIREARSKDPKLDYRTAFGMVMTADPKLHREYLDTDPPVHFQMGGAS
jgi:hypothetical protein